MSDFLQSHGPWPARLLCPWHSPSKNTGVGYHALLEGDLPDPGIKPASLMSPALAGGFFTTSTTWEAQNQTAEPIVGQYRESVSCPVVSYSLQPRQESWGGLPFTSPRDLPDPGMEPGSHALQENCLPSELLESK